MERDSERHMRDCQFCKIVRGEGLARVVFDSEETLAFFPLKPAALGHTLVIPKAHISDFLSMTSDAGAFSLARDVVRVGRALDRALGPEGINAITSAREAATQTIFHLHIHLVPRWHNDRIGQIWPPADPLLEDVADEVAELVRKQLSSDSV